MTIRILLSYRRRDSAAMTGRIFDRLRQRFGRKSVFLDVDSIPFGTDFRAHIDGEMRISTVLIAVIGTEWLGTRDGDALTRITDDQDPIRIEIASALKLSVPIIPVLVNDATMPKAAELPVDITPLSYLNAIEISSGRDFHPHMDRLIQSIGTIGPGGRWTLFGTSKRKARISIVATAIVGLAIGSVIVGSRSGFLNANHFLSFSFLVPKADLCGAVNAIVANTDKGFVDLLQGSPHNSSDNNKSLPGYEQCTIQKLSDVAYSCQSAESFDKATADTTLKSSAAQMKTCLGGGWDGPRSFYGGWSLNKSETGDTIVLMNTKTMNDTNAISYAPSFIAYRHVEAPEQPALIEDAKVPTDFCADLTKVIASSANSFEDIKGYDEGGYWLSKLGLKGFKKCDINPFADTTSKRRYYGCRLEPFSSEITAKVALRDLADKTASCLTTSWFRESDTDGRNRPRWTFHAPSDPLDVELRMTTGLHSTWQIHMDVNMER